MKILRIRLKNLNSLKGEHLVDLTAEPLSSAGLFAITGPTGAGKSTLLDAVTLAFYGRAARYGNESNPEHMMSRHCGECSAEVEFEVPSGRYRAVWQRHRAKKSPEGALQAPKRYIYDEAGAALAQQIREAEQKIEELLGLNYERFLRSALLAQGEFARFLKADANERAELLESLTGTAIYSRLSKRAHEEAGGREQSLRAREASLQSISILPPEDREELDAAFRKGALDLERIGEEIAGGSETLGRIASLAAARAREASASAERKQVEKLREASTPDRARLHRHRLTLPFASLLVRLEEAGAAWTEARRSREAADSRAAAAKVAFALAAAALRASIAAALAASQREEGNARQSATVEAGKAAEARDWLESRQRDAILTDQGSDLSAAIADLRRARISLAKAWASWRGTALALFPDAAAPLPETIGKEGESSLHQAMSAFLEKAETRKSSLEAEGKEANRQLALRKDHLETAKLRVDLAEHRASLVENQPCPLCGALEHPWADGAAPSPALNDLRAEVEAAEARLEQARDAYRNLKDRTSELAASRAPLLAEVLAAGSLTCDLASSLLALGEEVPAAGAEEAFRASLRQRERDYRARLKAADDAAVLKAEAERMAQAAAEQAAALREKLAALPSIPAAEEARVAGSLTEDPPPVPRAEAALAAAAQEDKIAESLARERLEAEAAAAKTRDARQQDLTAALDGSGFASPDDLRQARLEDREAARIETQEAGWERQAANADALAKQAKQEIGRLLEKAAPEGPAAEAFKAKQAELGKERDALNQQQGTRDARIKADEASRKLRQEKEAELARAREELEVWKLLRELIGSHDGSKFRRYAQSISLDILVRHANRHLARLTDRYLICRDEEEQLNLLIEDLHQAGVRRPMKSLSGGESFLASLALALGLSDLAGRAVRIDSLFIDEGFGSLDPESLEVAISALESLRQNHKTVGIISHVDLLKERIGTQITVEKLPGGVSRVRVVSG